MAQQNLDIIINAQDRTAGAFNNASKGVESFSDKLNNLQPTFQKMAAAGTVAFAALSGVAITSFKAFAEAEASTAVSTQILENAMNSLTSKQLSQSTSFVKANSDALEELKGKMNDAGKAAIRLGFDDEEASRSFAKLFQVTKNTTQANKELQTAMDLARLKGISLEDATQKLILVHSGATKELKLMGLAVKEGATAMENFDAISRQASGTAETFANTAEGVMERLKVQSGNLQEAIGGALAPVFAKLLDKVEPVLNKLIAWIEKNPELVGQVLAISAAVAGFVAVLGGIGLILPTVLAGFALLSAPVVAIGAAIALIAFNFDTFKNVLTQVYDFLADVGVIQFFKDIWESISNTYQNVLNPALQKLWDLLKQLSPVFEIVGKVIGVIFLASVMALAKALEYSITLFASIFSWATKIAEFFSVVFKKAIEGVTQAVSWLVEKIEALISAMSRLWEKAKSFGGNILNSIGNGFNSLFGGGHVNDGIVQNGKIISTHPDDYIFATKDPASLATGGAVSLYISGNQFLSESAAFEFGDIILNRLRQELRI